MAADFLDRHLVQPGVVQDLARRLGAAPTGLDTHANVFVVRSGQFNLGVNTQEQPRYGQKPVITQYHKVDMVCDAVPIGSLSLL